MCSVEEDINLIVLSMYVDTSEFCITYNVQQNALLILFLKFKTNLFAGFINKKWFCKLLHNNVLFLVVCKFSRSLSPRCILFCYPWWWLFTRHFLGLVPTLFKCRKLYQFVYHITLKNDFKSGKFIAGRNKWLFCFPPFHFDKCQQMWQNSSCLLL